MKMTEAFNEEMKNSLKESEKRTYRKPRKRNQRSEVEDLPIAIVATTKTQTEGIL